MVKNNAKPIISCGLTLLVCETVFLDKKVLYLKQNKVSGPDSASSGSPEREVTVTTAP